MYGKIMRTISAQIGNNCFYYNIVIINMTFAEQML